MRTTCARTRSTVMSSDSQDAGRQALLLAEQTEENVLGPDVIVLKSPGLFLRQDDHLTGSLCESLKHWLPNRLGLYYEEVGRKLF